MKMATTIVGQANEDPMAEKIRNLLKRNHVSFAEIMRKIPEAAGDKTLSSDEYINLIYWCKASDLLICTLNRMLKAGEFHFVPTITLTYWVDGCVLNLPIAKRLKSYKRVHWLPVVLVRGRYKTKGALAP